MTTAGDPQPVVDELASVRVLHETYAPALYAFAYRALGDRGAAEEVVQDTLVRAWRNAHRFDPARASLRTWLFAIARNLITDHHRRASARPRATVELDDAAIATVDEDLERVVESWQVSEAMGRLTPAHREVIAETYFRGSSVADAAARLGIPPGTVKSRLYYGLRALRLALEELGVVG